LERGHWSAARQRRFRIYEGGYGMGRTPTARLAQSVERKALNLVVVGSSPTSGVP
jgi:hypothetical protein